MKKIVIATLPLAKGNETTHYTPKGNFVRDYPHRVHYSCNAFLAQTLTKDDQVKLILIKTSGGANAGDENAEIFVNELNEINANCGATIEKPVIIEADFEPDKNQFHKIFLQLVKELDYKAKIYADLTFGHKAYPVLLMTVLQFAEKYYNADIANIIYGKVEFVERNVIDQNKSALYDLSPLYGLSSLSNVMQASTAEKAIQAIDTFFTM